MWGAAGAPAEGGLQCNPQAGAPAGAGVWRPHSLSALRSRSRPASAGWLLRRGVHALALSCLFPCRRPLFEWRDRVHGSALRWLILVEDTATEHIYHSEVRMALTRAKPLMPAAARVVLASLCLGRFCASLPSAFAGCAADGGAGRARREPSPANALPLLAAPRWRAAHPPVSAPRGCSRGF